MGGSACRLGNRQSPISGHGSRRNIDAPDQISDRGPDIVPCGPSVMQWQAKSVQTARRHARRKCIQITKASGGGRNSP